LPFDASTAQIVDLAVRRNIKIIESVKNGLFLKSPVYTLELQSLENLLDEELKFLDIFFPSRITGTRYELKQPDTKIDTKIQKLEKFVAKHLIDLGYRQNYRTKHILYKTSILSCLLFLIAGLAVLIINNNNPFAYFIRTWYIFFTPLMVYLPVAIIFRVSNAAIKPLTKNGRELLDNLEGLKLYIKMAEIDRIKFLQSPKGADREPIDTDSNEQMIILYERLLPYAILFGWGTGWSQIIGKFYESSHTSPQWYSGGETFSAETFSSSFSSFSSYAGSSASSSSSGAGGGGSSGGGGGGGGGGGR
jgi:uncharacterized membrane protein YgcG